MRGLLKVARKAQISELFIDRIVIGGSMAAETPRPAKLFHQIKPRPEGGTPTSYSSSAFLMAIGGRRRRFDVAHERHQECGEQERHHDRSERVGKGERLRFAISEAE